MALLNGLNIPNEVTNQRAQLQDFLPLLLLLQLRLQLGLILVNGLGNFDLGRFHMAMIALLRFARLRHSELTLQIRDSIGVNLRTNSRHCLQDGLGILIASVEQHCTSVHHRIFGIAMGNQLSDVVLVKDVGNCAGLTEDGILDLGAYQRNLTFDGAELCQHFIQGQLIDGRPATRAAVIPATAEDAASTTAATQKGE